ncbi:MAG: riboflavin synthase [Patescibacteria group bacterium]
MFTGIIEVKVRVISVEKNGGMQVRVEKPRGWKLAKGQSVSVDGICSTIERFSATHFDVTYIRETLRVTTAGGWKSGRVVNLERSMKAGAHIEGHIVQGHVDGVGVVRLVRARGNSKEVTITAPHSLMRFVARKGSVAVDGVSLTVAERTRTSFTAALVPYTLTHTTLGTLQKGDRVNIETDLFVRYLAALRGK